MTGKHACVTCSGDRFGHEASEKHWSKNSNTRRPTTYVFEVVWLWEVRSIAKLRAPLLREL